MQRFLTRPEEVTAFQFDPSVDCGFYVEYAEHFSEDWGDDIYAMKLGPNSTQLISPGDWMVFFADGMKECYCNEEFEEKFTTMRGDLPCSDTDPSQ